MVLRSGDSLEGLAKLVSNERIKFRKDRKYPKRTYNYREVSEIFINEAGRTKHYQYKVVERNADSYVKLVEVISQGKLNLYRVHKQGGYSGMTHHMGAGMTMSMGGSYNINEYFVGEVGSDIVKRLTSTGNLFERNFKKAAVEYFKDCPALVSKLEEKIFGKNDLEEIVGFYNKECF